LHSPENEIASQRRGSFMSNIFFSARRECDKKSNTIICSNISSSNNSDISLSTLTRQNSNDINIRFKNDSKTTIAKIGGISALPVVLCGLLQKELFTQPSLETDTCAIFQNSYTGYMNKNHYINIEQQRVRAGCALPTIIFI
jgi:hypothetical protein